MNVLCLSQPPAQKTNSVDAASLPLDQCVGYLLLKTLELCKSNSWCQHFFLYCTQYWQQCHPGGTVPLSSLQ